MYDKEVAIKSLLDTSIGLPLTILTLIVGINNYLLKDLALCFQNSNDFIIISLVVNNLLLIIYFIGSIIFLIASYTNGIKGFEYSDIGNLMSIREWQNDFIKTAENEIPAQLEFEDNLIDQLASITDDNTKVNNKRTFCLYIAKCLVMMCVLFSIINLFLIQLLNYLL